MRIKTRLSGIRGRIFRCRLGNWFGTEMRRYDGDWGESGERPPYWNIRLREANSSSGREREREKDRDWRNGRLATRESFSDFVQFDRLSGILSSFY